MKKYDTAIFEKAMKSFFVSVSDSQIAQFLAYYEILVEWNSVMNLTAITEYEEVMIKHFVDSLAVCQADVFRDALNHTEKREVSLIDIGTGAGFPGIPLKIIFPDLKVVLLDSLKKRVKFLDTVAEKLQMKNINAIHGRAEDFARDQLYREEFDFSVSRAVANLSTLTELCIPFVKRGGYFISYKSEKVKEELSAGKKAIEILGGKMEDQLEYNLPDTDIKRSLLLVKKEKSTPKKYPRKAGTPAKEPLL